MERRAPGRKSCRALSRGVPGFASFCRGVVAKFSRNRGWIRTNPLPSTIPFLPAARPRASRLHGAARTLTLALAALAGATGCASVADEAAISAPTGRPAMPLNDVAVLAGRWVAVAGPGPVWEVTDAGAVTWSEGGRTGTGTLAVRDGRAVFVAPGTPPRVFALHVLPSGERRLVSEGGTTLRQIR
jgi:hypothetical protein